MLVLITYDVSTTDSAGKRRLRQVAKSASPTANESKIPSSSAIWTRLNTSCFRLSSAS